MAEDDDTEKTEEPTDKKRQKAAEQGNVANSQEIKNWSMLLGATMVVVALGPWMANRIYIIVRKFLESPHGMETDIQGIQLIFSHLIEEVGITILPVMGLMIILVILASVGQTGLVWSPAKLEPKWSKFNPISGAKKMFSVTQMLELVKGLVKLGIVGAVSVVVSIPLLSDVELLPGREILEILNRMWLLAIGLALGTVGVMTVVAVLDLLYTRWKHTKDLRMTKQEVKDERKGQEGDPLVKSKLRSIRMQRARVRMMAAVEDATVVVTNPTHYAVALKYSMEDTQAPVLVAKGLDKLAMRIREKADEHDVPIVENPPLARALYAAVELDQEIPEEHFKAVAEVIGYVMRLKGKLN